MIRRLLRRIAGNALLAGGIWVAIRLLLHALAQRNKRREAAIDAGGELLAEPRRVLVVTPRPGHAESAIGNTLTLLQAGGSQIAMAMLPQAQEESDGTVPAADNASATGTNAAASGRYSAADSAEVADATTPIDAAASSHHAATYATAVNPATVPPTAPDHPAGRPTAAHPTGRPTDHAPAHPKGHHVDHPTSHPIATANRTEAPPVNGSDRDAYARSIRHFEIHLPAKGDRNRWLAVALRQLVRTVQPNVIMLPDPDGLGADAVNGRGAGTVAAEAVRAIFALAGAGRLHGARIYLYGTEHANVLVQPAGAAAEALCRVV
jgi:hypothetical protein